MMNVSRHKSMDTLWGYVRRADLFREHAGAAFLRRGNMQRVDTDDAQQ
jgi:hypothetical protein